MKNIFIIALLLFTLTGCEKLTNVIDQDPPNSLVPENVAVNAAGARNLLNGTYAMLHDQYYYLYSETVPGLLSGSMKSNGFLASVKFADNAVLADQSDVNSIWTAYYKMINQANWVIQLVNKLPEGELSQPEKDALLAQAKALRAMAHFDALRYFGQFYDLNSKLGVIIRTEPVNFTTREIKRSSVAEAYNLILSDLDFAVSKAPDFTKPIFISKTAAKALKARVLLFKGDYLQAANLANEVITDGKRSLSVPFSKGFSDGFNSSESIFMRATDAVTFTSDRKKFTYGSRHAIASPWLQGMMAGDPRVASTYLASNSSILKTNNTAFSAPTYFIRLAEMYLIKAEGLARSGAPLADAKAALEVIISRAYGKPSFSLATTHEELLNDIFKETIRELCFENGSDWFATIRFEKIKTLKPKVTSSDQYILPIPESELLGNALFGVQNPGY